MKITSALFLALALPAVAGADIYNCNGEWTNKPCRGKPTQVIKPGDSASRVLKPEEVREQSEKRSIFHELNMRNITARRELNVRVDITNVERTCLHEADKSADQCRAVAQEADAIISQRIAEARAQQAAETPESGGGTPPPTIEDNSNNVTIVDHRTNVNVVSSVQTGGGNELNVIQSGTVGVAPTPDGISFPDRSPSRMTNRPSNIRRRLTGPSAEESR